MAADPQRQTAGGTPETGAGLRSSVLEATRRIEEIIDAAERVAEEIRAEAEAEAGRYLEACKRDADRLLESRATLLADLAGELDAHASGLRGEMDRVVRAIEAAADRVRTQGGTRAAAATRKPEKPARAPQRPEPVLIEPEDAIPTTPAPEAAGGSASREAALLRATQMAVAGNSREEIEAALRDELRIDDPAAVAEEILGSG